MSIKLMNAAFGTALPATQKFVFVALCDNASDEGICYPSVARLCKKTSLSVRAVQGAIKRLVALGYMRVSMRKGMSTVYRIAPVSEWQTLSTTPAADAPPQDMRPAPDAPLPRTTCTPPPQEMRGTPAADAPITIIEPSYKHHGTVMECAREAEPVDCGFADAGVADADAPEDAISDALLADVGIADVGIADIPIADIPIADIPIADIPIADIPIADIPIADIPISDTLVSDALVSDALLADNAVSAIGTSGAPVCTALSGAPLSAAPVCTAVSGAPLSAAPLSAAPLSAAPLSAAPLSAAPLSAAPLSAAPVCDVPVSGKSRSSRKTRLPDDWFLPKDWGDWALDEGLSEREIRSEAQCFADHWRSKGEARADWQATWRNWIRRKKVFERRTSQAPPKSIYEQNREAGARARKLIFGDAS